MPNYGDPIYWDDRYKNAGKNATFDWLESYASLKTLLKEFMTDLNIRILILGCGNAEFSEDLYDAGFKNIVNVDISSVCIDQMNERNNELRPEMRFQVMDICDMSEFESNSFDIAIDKSTIDALLCGDDSFVKVAEMLKESQRVLKTGGVYFAISYGKPESRSFHFVQPFLSWENREFVLYDTSCETEEEKTEKSHYIYVSTKNADADRICAMNWEVCLEQLRLECETQKLIEAAEGGSQGEDNDSDDDGAIKELKEEEIKQEDGEESEDENLSSVRIILNNQEPASQPSVAQVVDIQKVEDKP